MTSFRDACQRLYHQLIPASIRNPIGLARRHLTDHVKRGILRERLPPSALLARVQLTAFSKEFEHIGRVSAAAVEEVLHEVGVQPGSRILDFGCGCGRTIRYLNVPWMISGCDVDPEAIDWCRANLQGDFQRTSVLPPLPYPSDSFQAIYAISVFTHFPESEQSVWAAELARVIAPDGLLILTTVGLLALGAYPALSTTTSSERLTTDGFLYFPTYGGFNASGAFHTQAGIERLFSPWFNLETHRRGGLDNFQDISVLRKRPRST